MFDYKNIFILFISQFKTNSEHTYKQKTKKQKRVFLYIKDDRINLLIN